MSDKDNKIPDAERIPTSTVKTRSRIIKDGDGKISSKKTIDVAKDPRRDKDGERTVRHDDDRKSFSECERVKYGDDHSSEREAIEQNVDTVIPHDTKMASNKLSESTVDKMADREALDCKQTNKMSIDFEDGVTEIQYGDTNVSHYGKHAMSTIEMQVKIFEAITSLTREMSRLRADGETARRDILLLKQIRRNTDQNGGHTRRNHRGSEG